jgi:phosphoglycerate dehydrogenase-like enzyme
MKVLVTMPISTTRDTFFDSGVVKRLESIADVEWNESTRQWGIKDLKDRLKDAEVCMTGWGSTRYVKEILDAAPNLKVLAHTGGSVASIVSDELYDRGVVVLSGNQLYAESVAEGVIAYMLCSLRRIVNYSNELQKGHWKEVDSYDEGLLDQSIGLVGFGAVAKFLAKMLVPFHMKIKAYDPFVKDEVLKEYGVERDSLENIFSQSKIISLHVAQTPDTHHMIGKELLQLIPDGALFVNTARPGIVDTEAMLEEFRKNRFNAFLDVYDQEPLPADSKLIGLSNVILMPHRGGPTVDRRGRVTMALIDDIQRIFRGEQPILEIGHDYAVKMTR